MPSHCRIALGIPHTPWIPERVESLKRLREQLASPRHEFFMKTRMYSEFSEKEPNWSWSKKLWDWGLETEATHLLQLQDDVQVAPNFWDALNAMIANVPDGVIGLQGAHPKFRTISNDGHRWAVSNAWMVGVGYVIPRSKLKELIQFRDVYEEAALKTNEDDFIANFMATKRYSVWHPIPTIVDHDTDVKSTYGNDKHLHRKATVTWRDFGEKEIESETFWRVDRDPPIITNPHLNRCWFCELEPVAVGFQETGAGIGRSCLAKATSSVLMQGVKQ